MARRLCEEWYPKINEILSGPGSPLPYSEVRIVFEPKDLAPRQFAKGAKGSHVASARLNVISLPSNWPIASREAEFRIIVIHELTHVAQDYALHLRCDGIRALPCFFQTRLPELHRAPGWLSDGIADYIAYTHFVKLNEPRLKLDRHGFLHGYSEDRPFLYGLERAKIRIGEKGYRIAYGVASAFLLWLEQKKDREVIRALNRSLRARRYSDRLFHERCGAPLDALWRTFLAESR
jgi:hypothetical protein